MRCNGVVENGHRAASKMSGIIEMPVGPHAVDVINASKCYGRGKKKVVGLQDCTMRVPKGIIYGLLGPSGCGKTTLLKCIVGRLRVDSGSVSALQREPGVMGHTVPGPDVGYMPQELALFMDFTIGETLSYFGRLHKMTSERISQRTEFLIDFLNLPQKNRQVSQLSGGQQRRVSFAIALLQEPQLIILDEPTVGVDPLLRQRIWEHLLAIVEKSQTTIVITTHYIEEARQAHTVGLMRSGRLLAEQSPEQLLVQHNLQSLEEVFLKLCQKDQVGDIEDDTNQDTQKMIGCSEDEPLLGAQENLCEENETLQIPNTPTVPAFEEPVLTCCQKMKYFMPSFWNFVALSIKNLIVMKRKIGLLVFEFVIPSMQIIFFCLCIGRPPVDLPMAIFNNETCTLPVCASQSFLKTIDNNTIIQHNFSSLESAKDSVKAGDSWGVVYIKQNFTTDLIKRFSQVGTKLDNQTLEGSTIYLYLDMSNQQIYLTIQQTIFNAFQAFAERELSALGKNPAVAELPVKLGDPIYGDKNPNFVNFIAPGIILSITFFLASGLTALSFVLERKQGLLDRSYTAGVTPIEVMLAHTGTQFLILCGQVTLLLIFALGVFKVPYNGPLILVIVLTLMQGFTGMALGLVISALCEEENTAIQCTLGSVYPNLLLSGILWPIQGMPVWLRYISLCLPMTLAAESMRNILSRGWGLLYPGVYRGFLVTIGWGGFYLILAGILLKMKAKL